MLKPGPLGWRVIQRRQAMSVAAMVVDQFRQVAREQDKPLVALNTDTVLLESGLDSLCFAIIVARLEDQLGVDPFTASEDVYFPVTLGDFIKFYEDAAGSQAA
jgi:acyl carrier protein